jgi:uncharacterized membrane protein YgcG
VRWGRLALLWLALLSLAAGCGAAPEGQLLLVDETARLDRARVEAAARPLLARGAAVAVIAVPSGDDSGADFTRRLDEVGLLRAGRIAPQAIALYVSYAPRYSEIRAGTGWSARLPGEALREIRLEILNPALRADAASDGVAAALAALDVRIEAGPLGAWGGRLAWALYAGIAAVVVLIFAYHPLKRGLDATRRAWLASPAGQLVARLWQRSPPGRALARRELAQRIQAARQQLERAADGARGDFAQISLPAADLVDRLRDCDARRAELARRAPDQPDLLTALQMLKEDYRLLSADIARRRQDLQRGSGSVAQAAKTARAMVERVEATFQRALKATHSRRKRAGKLKPEISEAGRQRLADLRAGLQQIDQQRAALAQLALPALELIERQKRLAGDYDTLTRDATELWKAECPWAYQAHIASQAQARATTSMASDTSDTYSGSTSSSSSSFDSSNSFDYGSPSEPSSDGGAW